MYSTRRRTSNNITLRIFRKTDEDNGIETPSYHRPSLRDGRAVAVKVQRPDINKVIQADLDIIKNLSQLVERRLPNLAVYKPLALARVN